jgi:predicted deacylase
VLQEIQCQVLHGIVVAVPVANVPGYLAQQRGFTDGTDLNRLMPGYREYALSLLNRTPFLAVRCR